MSPSFVTRRILLLASLLFFGISSLARADSTQANAFSPIKGKLLAGKDAVLFINGDSTAYSENGPYYKFAKAIGESTGCKVLLYRWAEWAGGTPTGPKDYAEPVTIHDGTGLATLRVYLAALPGGVAGDMFAGARRANAVEKIPRPDGAILHQGHNMTTFAVAYNGDRAACRGLFFGAVGLTSAQWPGVPQAVVTQNPWKGGGQFSGVYEAIREVATLQPNLTLIDSHQAFIAAEKAPGLYRDNIHPSDSKTNSAGAQIVADALMEAWTEAQPGAAFSTPAWPSRSGVNLAGHGDFSDWEGAVPAGWTVGGGATIEKNAVVKDGGGLHSLAVRPNGSKGAFLAKEFSAEEKAAMRGKTISIALLVRSSPALPRVFAAFVCPVQGANRTFAFGDLNSGKDGWVWLVCAGIPVDATPPSSTIDLRIYPAFSLQDPTSNEALLIQRVVVAEGGLPTGLEKLE